jgi:pilus assembly protein CpaE
VGLGADKVESILGIPIAMSITTSMDIAAATNAGKPILVANPKHPSSRALTELAARLTGEPLAPSFDGGDTRPERTNGSDSEKAKSGSRFRIRR